MTALPADSTQRWFIDYSNGSTLHTAVVRGATGATLAQLDTEMEDFLNAISPYVCPFTINNVRHAAEGTNVSFPVESLLVNYSGGSGGITAAQRALSLSFTGRSTDAHQARLFWYGFNSTIGDYRLNGATETGIHDAVVVLNSSETLFRAIDGMPTQWHNYANVGANDYWVRKTRA